MRLFCCFFLSLIYITARCQTSADSTNLDEVTVKAYFTERPLLQVPASVGIITSKTLQSYSPASLLPALNAVPGVRMEERSPGSYRLSIRGSLLRSPFGIRNVKIYMDDFLLTDAGGNTYVNLLDVAGVGKIEVLKGPEGSVFGANSGGVVLISTQRFKADGLHGSAGISGGSFGLLQQNAILQVKQKDFQVGFNEAFQRSEGYRDNSAMNRKSVMLTPLWNYSPKAKLKSLLMYSDLSYQTPGGLNLKQAEANPKMARQATAVDKSAEEQRAAIYNKTFLGGIAHEWEFFKGFRHVISVTGSVTDFKNPFITNYEKRGEKSLGLRTYLEQVSDKNKTGRWTWQLGVESQQTQTDVRNYVNNLGSVGVEKTSDQLTARQSIVFAHASWQPLKRLTLESAISANFSNYSYRNYFPIEVAEQKKKFNTQWLPRLALGYGLTDELAWRISASKGYSAPTTAEVRASNNVINTDLQPEGGWNYETGFRMNLVNSRIYADIAAFSFDLKNAIVRREASVNAEFFVNAGGTQQKGVEVQLAAWMIPVNTSQFIRGLKLSESFTTSYFKFNEYKVLKNDFSGNWLTGVPRYNLVSAVDVAFPSNFNVFVQHSFVSQIPLNDANSVHAAKYHLLQAKLSWQKRIKYNRLQLFLGADNLLNTVYSLGNDLNAFGSRYYNPAATRNFYGGLTVGF